MFEPLVRVQVADRFDHGVAEVVDVYRPVMLDWPKQRRFE
jgi:hypothetical protein